MNKHLHPWFLIQLYKYVFCVLYFDFISYSLLDWYSFLPFYFLVLIQIIFKIIFSCSRRCGQSVGVRCREQTGRGLVRQEFHSAWVNVVNSSLLWSCCHRFGVIWWVIWISHYWRVRDTPTVRRVSRRGFGCSRASSSFWSGRSFDRRTCVMYEYIPSDMFQGTFPWRSLSRLWFYTTLYIRVSCIFLYVAALDTN